MNLQSLAIQVTHIARLAGQAIMEVYETKNVQIEQKQDNSPVTIADKRANTIICNGLNELKEVHFPIVSEENASIPYEERKHFDYYWLVDPLDGTKEFIKKNGEFTVNIALIHKDTPVLGVVYDPVLNEMYYAIKGQGAFLVQKNKNIALKTKPFHLMDEGVRVVASRSHLSIETENFLRSLNNPIVVPKGSSLKFLILARGEAQVYPRLGPTMEWDIAAAHIILSEAGGTVLEYESKQALKYNKKSLVNPDFIAFSKV